MNRVEFEPNRPHYTVPHPLRELTSVFLACQKAGALRRAADRIREYGGPLGHGIASYAFVDALARSKSEDTADRLRLYNAAADSAKQAINRSSLVGSTASAHIKAAMLLAELPLLKKMYIHRSYPNAQAMQASYTEGIEVVSAGREFTKSSDTATRKGDTGCSVTGAMSELCIKMLVNRYSIQQMQSGDYVAVSSLFSQDNVRVHKKDAIPWDISIFAANGSEEFHRPTYKLQVKTAATGNKHQDDVVFVSPRDLSTRKLPCNERLLGAYLIGEAQWDSTDATKALDVWSDVLLERIDSVG